MCSSKSEMGNTLVLVTFNFIFKLNKMTEKHTFRGISYANYNYTPHEVQLETRVPQNYSSLYHQGSRPRTTQGMEKHQVKT